MHTVHRLRSWFAVLAFAALLFAPWPAEAAPTHPVLRLAGWLADLWADAGFSFDPNGATARDAVGIPAEGFIFDPDGGSAATSTPPAGTASADAGFIFDPDGRP